MPTDYKGRRVDQERRALARHVRKHPGTTIAELEREFPTWCVRRRVRRLAERGQLRVEPDVRMVSYRTRVYPPNEAAPRGDLHAMEVPA